MVFFNCCPHVHNFVVIQLKNSSCVPQLFVLKLTDTNIREDQYAQFKILVKEVEACEVSNMLNFKEWDIDHRAYEFSSNFESFPDYPSLLVCNKNISISKISLSNFSNVIIID